MKTSLKVKVTVPEVQVEPQALFMSAQLDTSVSRRCMTTAVVFIDNLLFNHLTQVAEGSVAQGITQSVAKGKNKTS
jgi:hypothetical protein